MWIPAGLERCLVVRLRGVGGFVRSENIAAFRASNPVFSVNSGSVDFSVAMLLKIVLAIRPRNIRHAHLFHHRALHLPQLRFPLLRCYVGHFLASLCYSVRLLAFSTSPDLDGLTVLYHPILSLFQFVLCDSVEHNLFGVLGCCVGILIVEPYRSFTVGFYACVVAFAPYAFGE